jgi:ribonuclease HII
MRSGYSAVAGLDEAGRGAWAGPVVAAAVILNLSVAAGLRKVNDSKQLTPRQREALYPLIVEASLAHAVGLADSIEIDEIGIVPATRLAMRRALDALTLPADALIIDAVKLREVDLPQSVFNFADSISLSVAAASILAKVTRDRMMVDLAAQFPEYGFERHKGYGTRAHRAALQATGPSCIHRQTFKPIRAWLCHDRGSP